MNSPYLVRKNGVSLSLQVRPGSAKAGFAGTLAGRLKLKLLSRPVDGQANLELCQFLSEHFQVPKSCITITHGQSSRTKTVFIEAPTKPLLDRLELLLSAGPDT